MERWSKIIVQKANIIYPAENFYCAGIVISEAFGKFQNTPPRVTDDLRTMGGANRRLLPQRSYLTISLRGGAWTKPAHTWEVILWVIKYSTRNGSRAVNSSQQTEEPGWRVVLFISGVGIFGSPKRIDFRIGSWEPIHLKNRNQRIDFARIDLKNRIKILKLSNNFYTVLCNNF